MIEQLPLLSHNLEPLTLYRRVRVIAEDYVGVISQIWPGRDYYVVFAGVWRPRIQPFYRRDELEALPLLDEEAERAAVVRIFHVPGVAEL